MNTYKLAPEAEDDLDLVWSFIAGHSVSAADRHLARLIHSFELLADNPRMGRMNEELSMSLRSHPVGDYLIFYRVAENGIEIARILQGNRDIRKELGEA